MPSRCLLHPRSLFAVAVVEDGRKSLSPTRAIVKIVERKQSCRTMGWNGKGCWWRRMSRLSTVSQSFDLATGYTPLCSYLLFIYFFSPTPTPTTIVEDRCSFQSSYATSWSLCSYVFRIHMQFVRCPVHPAHMQFS